ncbi:MAG: hypothetical protein ACYC6Y_03835 [Thermoguttaceae bacterium]
MDHDLIDWRLEYGAGSIDARPTAVNFVKRLAWTFVAGLFVYFLYSQRDMPAGNFSSTWHRAVLVMCGLLGALGLLVPLSVLWQRARIERGPDGELVISELRYWPRTIRIPPGTITSMPVALTEERVRTRHVRRTVGWRWRVLLVSPTGKEEFWIDQDAAEPPDTAMPRRVRQFVAALEAMTGVESMPPQRSAWAGNRRSVSLGRRFHTTSEPAVVRQTFRSLDEVPPELRGKVDAMIQEAEARNVSVIKQQTFKIRDSQGREQTYHSLEEMPPDVRATFEVAMRRSQNR